MSTTRISIAALVGTIASATLATAEAADLATVKHAIVAVRWQSSVSIPRGSHAPGAGVPAGSPQPNLIPLADVNVLDGSTPGQILIANPYHSGKRTHRATGFWINGSILTILPKSALDEQAKLIVVDAHRNEHQAMVLLRDESSDLTLLSIDAPSPPDGLMISESASAWGEEVRVIHEYRPGNPALIRGIVSTSPEFDGNFRAATFDIDGITPVNSVGAPVLNEANEVIAIVKGQRSNTGDAGPAIVLEASATDKLLASAASGQTGIVPKPMIGAALGDFDGAVVIQKILPKSPAEEAGLLAGDVIRAVNSIGVSQAKEVIAIINRLTPGEAVSLSLERNDEKIQQQITVGNASEFHIESQSPVESENANVRLSFDFTSPALPGTGVMAWDRSNSSPLSEAQRQQIETELRNLTERIAKGQQIGGQRVQVTAVPPDVSTQLEALRSEIAEIKALLQARESE